MRKSLLFGRRSSGSLGEREVEPLRKSETSTVWPSTACMTSHSFLFFFPIPRAIEDIIIILGLDERWNDDPRQQDKRSSSRRCILGGHLLPLPAVPLTISNAATWLEHDGSPFPMPGVDDDGREKEAVVHRILLPNHYFKGVSTKVDASGVQLWSAKVLLQLGEDL